jgi:hypothetical protein
VNESEDLGDGMIEIMEEDTAPQEEIIVREEEVEAHLVEEDLQVEVEAHLVEEDLQVEVLYDRKEAVVVLAEALEEEMIQGLLVLP